jgi:hypothetical protein
MSGLGAEQNVAAEALIVEETSVGRHCLRLLVTAGWACNGGFKDRHGVAEPCEGGREHLRRRMLTLESGQRPKFRDSGLRVN